jgi:hypothetical protein
LGDIPPSAITVGGIITAATYSDAANLVTIELTHSAIPYTNYLIFAAPYSNRSSSTDNDAW